MTRRSINAFLALTAAATLTACGTSAPTAQNKPASTTEDQQPDSCLTLTEGAHAKLSGKIAEAVPGSEVKRTGLVASAESDMWILAVEFTDPGLDRDFTGIWGSLQDLTTDEDPAFVAVDEVAEASAEYLQPVDFDGIGAQLPAAEEAVACLA